MKGKKWAMNMFSVKVTHTKPYIFTDEYWLKFTEYQDKLDFEVKYDKSTSLKSTVKRVVFKHKDNLSYASIAAEVNIGTREVQGIIILDKLIRKIGLSSDEKAFYNILKGIKPEKKVESQPEIMVAKTKHDVKWDEREKQFFDVLKQGKNRKQMAHELNISLRSLGRWADKFDVELPSAYETKTTQGAVETVMKETHQSKTNDVEKKEVESMSKKTFNVEDAVEKALAKNKMYQGYLQKSTTAKEEVERAKAALATAQKALAESQANFETNDKMRQEFEDAVRSSVEEVLSLEEEEEEEA